MKDTGLFSLPDSFRGDYLVEYINSTVFYLIFAGITFYIFYVAGKKTFARFKIQERLTKKKNVIREIKYSLLSLAVFSSIAIIIYHLLQHGYTKMYTDFSEYGTAYFAFTCVAMIFINDAFFYWAHRFIHWKKIYKHVHKVHHLSTDPTPWAALSFHPFEAMVLSVFQLSIVFIFPIHYWATLVVALFTMLYNFMGHLGYEMFPDRFATNKFTKWSNTATHHNMHHKLFHWNFGLYFNFWDRLMGTQHPEYEKEFAKVRLKAKALKPDIIATHKTKMPEQQTLKQKLKKQLEPKLNLTDILPDGKVLKEGDKNELILDIEKRNS